MLWRIKKIPVIYIVLIILTGALLVYFFQNYKVEDDQSGNKEDNQLSILGASSSSIPFATPANAAITANQTPVVAGPQAPSNKPSSTPKPTPTPSPSPSPTESPSPTPTPTETPSPIPTATPTLAPTPTPSPTEIPSSTP